MNKTASAETTAVSGKLDVAERVKRQREGQVHVSVRASHSSGPLSRHSLRSAHSVQLSWFSPDGSARANGWE